MELLWHDRKRIIFGLPWTFTKYSYTEEKLFVETGFLNKREEEIRLYRIMDVTLIRPFWQRIFGLGTVHCCSSDRTAGEFDLKRIKHSAEVKNQLSDLVEEQRVKKRVYSREFMDPDDDIDEADSH